MYDFYMKNKTNIFIFIVWFAISLFAIFHHEMWRDETQVWCIVRDLNLPEIFQTTRIEGHPMLWYLLVLPFAKLGFAVESIQIISFIFVAASVLFMLFKSPFNLVQKVLISFSAGMVYFLPVIARNYALIPILIFLLAEIYPKRGENPWKYSLLLILLSQTHVMMLAFCGVLFLFFLIEKIKEKKDYFPLFVLLLNFAFLAFSFSKSLNENIALIGYREQERTFFELVYDFSYNFFAPYFVSSMPINCIIFYVLLTVILVLLFKESKKIFLLFLSSFIYIFYIFAKVWFSGIAYQKLFVLMLILIFCVWNLSRQSEYLRKAFNILLVISILVTIPTVIDEYKYEFSGSKQIATYIKENIKDKEFVVIGYSHVISPLSAMLPDRKFYSEEENRYVTYFEFDIDNEKTIVKPDEIKYYIVQEDSFLFEELGYKLLFKSDDYILGPKRQAEVYKIYEKI